MTSSTPSKDHATLIRAFALLVQRHSLQLVLAGDGILRPQLEQLAEECGIREQVTFVGNVERERLLRLYRQASVFTFSTHGEGRPLALLEAMSCRLPVVASDVPGVGEILAGSECGLLVPPGEPEEMAQAIERILKDPGLGSRIGPAGRHCVAINHSLGRMAARYQEVLSALCE